MDEQVWQECTDLERLIKHLKEANAERLDRKARLFACACVRQAWMQLHAQGQKAVEEAERFADGLGTPEDLASCRNVGMEAWSRAGMAWGVMLVNGLAVSLETGFAAALYAAKHAPETLVPPGAPSRKAAKADVRRSLRGFFMDIFGNPFRPMPPLPPPLLTWRDGLIPKLAEAAYENRILPSGHLDLARLGVLGDSLEEAGCTDAELLGHVKRQLVFPLSDN